MIRQIWNRLISDYFISNRINEYEKFIKYAIENEYSIVSHSTFFKLATENKLEGKKIMMIRHDIDSDPKYCKQWLAIEKKYNIQTSYYFRLCTVDLKMMKEVYESGSDCGYHYEELADYAKRNKLKSRNAVELHLPQIQSMFKRNLLDLEKRLGFKIRSIASHGDFANKLLKMNNHEFVDAKILKDNDLDFESYQNEFLTNYSINISDCSYPLFFKQNISPIDAIDAKHQIIHVLIHPRHWRSSWYWNTYENIKRIVEGIKFK